MGKQRCPAECIVIDRAAMAEQDPQIWPISPFLSHSVAPSFNTTSRQAKCGRWLSLCLNRGENSQQNRSSRRSSTSRNQTRTRRYNRREFISTLSDVFSITGGITAITGTLVASFGIFPRNQVSLAKQRCFPF